MHAQDSTLWQLTPEEIQAYIDATSGVSEIVFIAPRPGTLRIIPDGITRANNPTASSAYLQVEWEGNTDTTTVLRYFTCSGSFTQNGTDTCLGTPFSVQIYWSFQQIPPNCPLFKPKDTLYVGPVETGDTVRFSYHGQYNSPTLSLYLAGDSLWRVGMSTSPANALCLVNPYALEGCSALVSYADTVLRIQRPDSLRVYPTYPRWNNLTSKKNFVDLTMSVEFAETAIPDYFVKVDRPTLVDSGGHSHNGNRPMATYFFPVDSTDTLQTLTTKTDSTGKIKFRYLASQFGGSERIKARLVSDTTKTDTLTLTTRVAGLDSLATSAYYLKVGASGDWDTCDATPPTSLHYGNHYAIPSLRVAIDSIATKYFAAHDSVRLRVNDISLKYGGMFDYKNQWAANHTEHREGKHADIEYDEGINPQNDCVDIVKKKEELRKLIRDFTTGKIFEHPISNPHFHIRMK